MYGFWKWNKYYFEQWQIEIIRIVLFMQNTFDV